MNDQIVEVSSAAFQASREDKVFLGGYAPPFRCDSCPQQEEVS